MLQARNNTLIENEFLELDRTKSSSPAVHCVILSTPTFHQPWFHDLYFTEGKMSYNEGTCLIMFFVAFVVCFRIK